MRDLYLNEEWTNRFTELIDQHVKFSDEGNLLYINAGTGDHVYAIRERLTDATAVFATAENEDILAIARDKAAAIKSDIDFSMTRFEDESFDKVVADASFVSSGDLPDFVDDAARVAKAGGAIAVIFVTSGSFGEIFSLLWEVLFNEDLGEHGQSAERLITAQPTVTLVEKMAADAGLVNLNTHTVLEVFEYDDGAAFIRSPLVADFLLPKWLEFLSENEKEQVISKLARLIDAEDADLTFRFSVKATLLTAEKA